MSYSCSREALNYIVRKQWLQCSYYQETGEKKTKTNVIIRVAQFCMTTGNVKRVTAETMVSDKIALQALSSRVYHENMFFQKEISTTHHASAWGLV